MQTGIDKDVQDAAAIQWLGYGVHVRERRDMEGKEGAGSSPRSEQVESWRTIALLSAGESLVEETGFQELLE